MKRLIRFSCFALAMIMVLALAPLSVMGADVEEATTEGIEAIESTDTDSEKSMNAIPLVIAAVAAAAVAVAAVLIVLAKKKK